MARSAKVKPSRLIISAVPTASLIELRMAEKYALLSMPKVATGVAAVFTFAVFVAEARLMPCGSTPKDSQSRIPPTRKMLTDRPSGRCVACVISLLGSCQGR